jgi:hypothetical protein
MQRKTNKRGMPLFSMSWAFVRATSHSNIRNTKAHRAAQPTAHNSQPITRYNNPLTPPTPHDPTHRGRQTLRPQNTLRKLRLAGHPQRTRRHRWRQRHRQIHAAQNPGRHGRPRHRLHGHHERRQRRLPAPGRSVALRPHRLRRMHDRLRRSLALEQEQESLAHKLSELDPAAPEYAQVANRFHQAEGEFRAVRNQPEEPSAAK